MLPQNQRRHDLSEKLLDINSMSLYQIPSVYLNSFGFIDYKHNGSLPWAKEDKDIFLSAEYVSVTDYLAIDCEMVAVGSFKKSALGRVSIVNEYGYCIYDTFVNPMDTITDYGTQYSGIRPEDLVGAPWSDSVVEHVASIVEGKVLVGHSIHNDLEVLELNDHTDIRDTAIYFKNLSGSRCTPSLKKLTSEYFNVTIQSGEHNSIQDAQATLKLYLLFREAWEKESFERRKKANLADTIPDISCMHVQPRQPDVLANNKSVFIRPNKVVGAYFSSEEYRDIQFRLLLEDFLRPLRQDVRLVKQQMKLENHFRNIRISQGYASEETTFEVKSSKTLLVPVEQNGLQDVDWDDRNIFIHGSLLLISPDNFQSFKCAKVLDVVVNERKDAPLRIFVQFLLDGPNWTITDRHRFQMIESQAFFLPYEYTLNFLQVVDFDLYPMKKYIVDAVTKSKIAPNFLNGSNRIDLAVLMNETNAPTISCVNPLDYENWPNARQLNLDPSQFEALQKAITQELTIIQGPPGTGKTFISLQIVKLILTNKWLNKSPMLIVSYTNHALDQLLEPILQFLTDKIHGGNQKKAEQALLRFGGGCKSDSIIPCTATYKKQKFQEKNRNKNQVQSLEKALYKVKDLNFKTKLIDQGILNFKTIPQIMLAKLATNEKTKNIFELWTKSSIDINKNVLAWFGLDDTTINLRKSTAISDGLFLLLSNNLATILKGKFPYIPLSAEELHRRPLYNQNLEKQYLARWGHYLFLVDQLAEIIVTTRHELILANAASRELKDYVKYETALKQANIIAMTTTGAVKFKKILENTLKPKIMLVEEAAHVLEAYVVASLTRHCTQLILIGDHKQLRPMISDHNLKDNYLDVSLMERLVKNGINQNTQNWTQLKVQHRMRPEIARLICPVIYQELENHSDVEYYPDVKGCSKNLFFIHHEHGESKETRSMSRFNNYEAQYIIGLLSYFTDICGYFQCQITVICTYLAQKNLIETTLKTNPSLNEVEISTVDGYQGKQNDIILLSLVRNNSSKNVGFLKTDNRVCVALSRARHGLFMIGNMSILASSSDTWSEINKILVENQSIGSELPLHYPHTFKLQTTLASNTPETLQNKKNRRNRRGRRRRGGRGRKKNKEQSSNHDKDLIIACKSSHNSSNILTNKNQCNKNSENEKAGSVSTCGRAVNISGVQRVNNGHAMNINRVQPANNGHAMNISGVQRANNGHVMNVNGVQLANNGHVTNVNGVQRANNGHANISGVQPANNGHVTNVNGVQRANNGHANISGVQPSNNGHVTNVNGVQRANNGHAMNISGVQRANNGHAMNISGVQRANNGHAMNISGAQLANNGHVMNVSQVQRANNVKCLETSNKKLPLGHENLAHSQQQLTSQTCSNKITKLPCGHEHSSPGKSESHSTIHPCDNSSSKVECCVNISEDLPCGHKIHMPCNQKGKLEKSEIKCLTYVKHKFPCGHIHRFPCFEKKIKCGSLIRRKLPCGHTRDTACHQNPELIKCRQLVAFNGVKKKIECCNFVEIAMGTVIDALKSTKLQ